jgi:hypothetical protein
VPADYFVIDQWPPEDPAKEVEIGQLVLCGAKIAADNSRLVLRQV